MNSSTRWIVAASVAAVFAAAVSAGGPVCEFPCDPPPPAVAHVAWVPETTLNVQVGQVVSLALYVFRDPSNVSVRTAGLQTVIYWDPTKLQLLGNVNNGPYAWMLSNFPDDSGIDNLNDGVNQTPVGVPFNDGDAFYNALAQLPPPFGIGPALIPSSGLLVTTVRFQALAATPMTEISIPDSAATATCSAVFWGEGSPGCEMTGTLGSAFVQIEAGEPTPGDGDGDGDVDLDDYVLFLDCVGPGPVPPECAPFDFDLDGDVDLIDFAGFQVVFGS